MKDNAVLNWAKEVACRKCNIVKPLIMNARTGLAARTETLPNAELVCSSYSPNDADPSEACHTLTTAAGLCPTWITPECSFARADRVLGCRPIPRTSATIR